MLEIYLTYFLFPIHLLISFPNFLFQFHLLFISHDLFLSLSYFPSLTKSCLNIQRKDNHAHFVCSLAGALMAGILQRRDTDSCVRMGLMAARLSLASSHPIAPTLTLASVDPIKVQSQFWPKPSFMWID